MWRKKAQKENTATARERNSETGRANLEKQIEEKNNNRKQTRKGGKAHSENKDQEKKKMAGSQREAMSCILGAPRLCLLCRCSYMPKVCSKSF